ncbi:MAG: hypothetical protein ACJ8NR_05900 [Sulfurifustis sp.]
MGEQELPIFRLVDGKLVQIPARDPKRRYASVASPQGTYLREFTDEEERERDAEEAQWKADEPKRQHAIREAAAEHERLLSSFKYENRLVAFIDILGWSRSVREAENQPELIRRAGLAANTLRSLTHFSKEVAKIGGDRPFAGDLRINHFSDSVLISAIADYHGQTELEWRLQTISLELLKLGFLIRGGVSYGALHHRRDMVFGPALVRAVDLEKRAVYPRVILDSNVSRAFARGVDYLDKDGTLLGNTNKWRHDADGLMFFDFLQPFPLVPGVQPNAGMFRATMEPVRKLVMSGLEEHAHDAARYAKYYWLGRYFNETCARYPDCGVKQITLP